MPKLLSKKGQISTEIGILVVATIAVSTIAAYYYISNYLNSNPDTPGKVANKTINTLNNASEKYSGSINSIL
ncbi:MAG TPA: class III signal peptide-containing protein [Methanothermococcus okinawensis]|uniref:Class III signal peptide-containing protein n=1 Tax=Methanothermococcus okinawensis TaxID=155863 RepID=A0A833E572_9EURY|nr:class III signal peptide-containing protein [Methanothermococcus okinawensis]